MKKKSLIFAAAAIILILATNLPLAWGYFSTYTEARGRIRLQPGEYDTEIKEDVSDWTKHVVISNTGDKPVYIRARAFSGGEYELSYESGGEWTLGSDGFYYYNGILEAGQDTPELRVVIKNPPKDPEEGQEFNVIVVYESIAVKYDANGNPYADWGATLKVRERSAE